LPSDDEQELRRWLVALAKEHPRWGWKRAYHHRRREGHHVNKNRVQRLWPRRPQGSLSHPQEAIARCRRARGSDESHSSQRHLGHGLSVRRDP
jgi:hypothetical protein